MATNREDAIYFARLSEQGERYEDMIKYMKQVAAVSKNLSISQNKQIFRFKVYKSELESLDEANHTIYPLSQTRQMM